ncbi:MAG: NUDIX domain-containing protein [Candidatus Parcubacteria bacterium]|nr:NUDIX domain-containing protein [Candidatus Parcubacteria bacterium]
MATKFDQEIEEVKERGYRPVAVACIINDQKILLVYKKEHELWQLPQGGIEIGESLADTLNREIKEELGLDLNIKTEQIEFLDTEVITFPAAAQGTREIKTIAGENIQMKGKRYYLVAVQSKIKDLDIAQTEFDDYLWADYDEAKKFAGKIYQTQKKRLTLTALKKLKEKNFLV